MGSNLSTYATVAAGPGGGEEWRLECAKCGHSKAYGAVQPSYTLELVKEGWRTKPDGSRVRSVARDELKRVEHPSNITIVPANCPGCNAEVNRGNTDEIEIAQ